VPNAAHIALARLERELGERVLIVTQTLSAVPALMLAVLTFADSVNVWHVLAIPTLPGLVHALGNPTARSLAPRLAASEPTPTA